ncbi:MAG: hypothetical protein STSR0008_25120 [Ignavibacterium sp.]
MRQIISYSLLIIFFAIGCQEPTSTNENNKVIFQTSNNSFFTTDSIMVSIENKTYSNFEVFLKCGEYLEMYYQKKENDSWSDHLWFSWMSLKCISTPETIIEHNNFQFIIPSNEINENGTYRLVLANNTNIVSNSFEVK